MMTAEKPDHGERFREMRPGLVQMTFVEFPGYEPTGGDWPVIMACPWWRGSCDDEEVIADEAMRLVDWALDKHPEIFGLDANTDYNDYNTLSISLAGLIADAASVVDDRVRVLQPERGGAYGDWYENVELHPGVVVQVMFFRAR